MTHDTPTHAGPGALRRTLELAGTLRRDGHTTATEMARRLQVDVKTVKRDILLLRRIGWQIKWCHTHRRYVLQFAPHPVLV